MIDRAPPRLYVTPALAQGLRLDLSPEHTHYLANVMRRRAGDEVLVFNGVDGEWRASITELAKRTVTLELQGQSRTQDTAVDVWLMFAPIKRQRVDLVAEKATEMGASRLQPVITRRTNAERVNLGRLQAHAVEAAEQCGILNVPRVMTPQPLERLLGEWDVARRILFCDESGVAPPAREVLGRGSRGPWAVLVGPEGGFDEAERAMLNAMPCAGAASLGPRILRADTAAVAALALFQAALGDW